MSQVSTITSPVNGDPVDADALRAVLQAIVDGVNSIDSTQLTSGCVTTDAIGPDQVTIDEMAASSVGTDQLVDEAVTLPKLGSFYQATGTETDDTRALTTSYATGITVTFTPTIDCYALCVASYRIDSAGTHIAWARIYDSTAPALLAEGHTHTPDTTANNSINLTGLAQCTADTEKTIVLQRAADAATSYNTGGSMVVMLIPR